MEQTEQQQKTGRRTPAGIKWILLAILFAASFGGLGYGGYILFRSVRTAADGIPPLLPSDQVEQAAPKSTKAPEKTFLGLKRKPSSAVVFQGTASGQNGEMLALISGETGAAGAELHGVKVLKITRQSVLLEFDGQEYLLEPGERLRP